MARPQAIEAALRRLAPLIPDHEAQAVVDQGLASPGLRGAAPEPPACLSPVASARHTFTDYDGLLAEGYDRDSARQFVLDDLDAVLKGWGVRRRLADEPEAGEP